MNKKVIMIWGIFIVLFGIVGIFGMLNQDLLVSDDANNDVYVPQSQTDANTTTKICTASLVGSSSSYKFNINDSGIVEKITITYNTSAGDVDLYTAAWELSQQTIPGVKLALSGESESFVLIATIDVASLNINALDESMLEDLNKFSIYLDSTNSYDSYKNIINATSSITYQCD